jgi:hypothetical protein
MSVSFIRKLTFNTLPIVLFISLSSGCANSDQGYGAVATDKPVPVTFGITDECVWTSQDSKQFPVEGCI